MDWREEAYPWCGGAVAVSTRQKLFPARDLVRRERDRICWRGSLPE
jgi:hypothetical protein